MSHWIETRYRGRLYRSRLEARWAAFFDLLGWPFEYEPLDLPGWIPDFEIRGSTPVLVEVKPYLLADWDRETGGKQAIEKMARSLRRSNWNGELLLVGREVGLGDDSPQIGLVTDCNSEVGWDVPFLAEAEMVCSYSQPTTYDFMHRLGGNGGYVWHTRDCSNPHVSVARLWSEAANRVQWKPRR